MDEQNVMMTTDEEVAMIFGSNKEDVMMTPDEEVAMIFSSNKEDGPTTSKRARLISTGPQASSSRDGDDHCHYGPSGSRSIGHSRQIWDDSSGSDSSSPVEMDTQQVYPNVEAYLSSIPQFDLAEHRRIPFYMELLGDNAQEIRTDLPKSEHYTDEAMEVVRRNFILSQLDYLIRENVRRTTKEESRKKSKRFSIIKPLATVARRDQGSKSE